MTAGVYAIINIATGMAYVGSTKDLDKRVSRHRVRLRTQQHENKPIQEAWDAYGASAFSVEMLEEVQPDDALLEEAERRWIARLATECPGGLYNLDLTGRRWRKADQCIRGHSAWLPRKGNARRKCKTCIDLARKTPESIQKTKERERRRQRIYSTPPSERTCPICNRAFVRPGQRVYDSEDCHRRADAIAHQERRRVLAAQKKLRPLACLECSTTFIPVGAQRFCSRKCTFRAWSRQRRSARPQQPGGEG